MVRIYDEQTVFKEAKYEISQFGEDDESARQPYYKAKFIVDLVESHTIGWSLFKGTPTWDRASSIGHLHSIRFYVFMPQDW